MRNRPDSEGSVGREPTAIEAAALEWVVRCERGLDESQERELAEWMTSHPQHRALFEEFGGTWTIMGRVGELIEVPGNVANFARPMEETKTAEAPGNYARRSGRKIWLPLAAAAAIAVAFFSWSRPEHHSVSVATEVGASRQLTLPDGSVVELNTDSAVVTAFAANERRVRLTRGEAYFQVAKDPNRPFFVEAGGVAVRAIGTAFNVRVRSEAVEVLVTEGRVRVSQDAAPKANATAATKTENTTPVAPAPPTRIEANAGSGATDVSAGERVIVAVNAAASTTTPAAPAVVPVSGDEVRRALAWQARRLDFSDTPLAEMVAEFNRYNRRPLVVADPNIAAKRFGGSFKSEDRSGFVRMLRESFGIVAEERGEQTILRVAH